MQLKRKTTNTTHKNPTIPHEKNPQIPYVLLEIGKKNIRAKWRAWSVFSRCCDAEDFLSHLPNPVDGALHQDLAVSLAQIDFFWVDDD